MPLYSSNIQLDDDDDDLLLSSSPETSLSIVGCVPCLPRFNMNRLGRIQLPADIEDATLNDYLDPASSTTIEPLLEEYNVSDNDDDHHQLTRGQNFLTRNPFASSTLGDTPSLPRLDFFVEADEDATFLSDHRISAVINDAPKLNTVFVADGVDLDLDMQLLDTTIETDCSLNTIEPFKLVSDGDSGNWPDDHSEDLLRLSEDVCSNQIVQKQVLLQDDPIDHGQPLFEDEMHDSQVQEALDHGTAIFTNDQNEVLDHKDDMLPIMRDVVVEHCQPDIAPLPSDTTSISGTCESLVNEQLELVAHDQPEHDEPAIQESTAVAPPDDMTVVSNQQGASSDLEDGELSGSSDPHEAIFDDVNGDANQDNHMQQEVTQGEGLLKEIYLDDSLQQQEVTWGSDVRKQLDEVLPEQDESEAPPLDVSSATGAASLSPSPSTDYPVSDNIQSPSIYRHYTPATAPTVTPSHSLLVATETDTLATTAPALITSTDLSTSTPSIVEPQGRSSAAKTPETSSDSASASQPAPSTIPGRRSSVAAVAHSLLGDRLDDFTEKLAYIRKNIIMSLDDEDDDNQQQQQQQQQLPSTHLDDHQVPPPKPPRRNRSASIQDDERRQSFDPFTSRFAGANQDQQRRRQHRRSNSLMEVAPSIAKFVNQISAMTSNNDIENPMGVATEAKQDQANDPPDNQRPLYTPSSFFASFAGPDPAPNRPSVSTPAQRRGSRPTATRPSSLNQLQEEADDQPSGARKSSRASTDSERYTPYDSDEEPFDFSKVIAMGKNVRHFGEDMMGNGLRLFNDWSSRIRSNNPNGLLSPEPASPLPSSSAYPRRLSSQSQPNQPLDRESSSADQEFLLGDTFI
ncbi:hypothetical protein DM01DRAFT_1336442 [Hesseltinella vesiculosa]|uniref:Uncharacterized protein n=1 Tax=Hesseltinella vesiculosa TaxID=101127 RepID=A0A1X2GGU1_9FUNG|nr:hypothetical protein DM01DRAFT_1336442 [Hesseltinella vesiculosa]